MVHALELLHSLIEPGGCLLDIHPSGEPPPIELIYGDQRSLVGYLQESDDFIEYGQADAAIMQATSRGWYHIEQESAFEFPTRASSLAELRDFLEHNWADAILSPEIDQKVAKLLGSPGAKDKTKISFVEIRERVRITRLKREVFSPLKE